jgi:hypothetical protein
MDSLLIADAGGAITLESAEGDTLPDLAVLGALRFEHNSSDLCLDRDSEVPDDSTRTIPPGFRLGFVRNPSGEVSQCRHHGQSDFGGCDAR